jgi:hypothetical protein
MTCAGHAKRYADTNSTQDVPVFLRCFYEEMPDANGIETNCSKRSSETFASDPHCMLCI